MGQGISGTHDGSSSSRDSSPDPASSVSKEEITDKSSEKPPPALSAVYREIILDCYEKAQGDTASRIVMRVSQQREDFRTFMDGLDNKYRQSLISHLRKYLNNVVKNVNDEKAVKEASKKFGEFHVRLRQNGFKPDFFAALADGIATECVFLGGSATAQAPAATFTAWTKLVDLMFSSVRDGYYEEMRRQRRTSSNSETVNDVEDGRVAALNAKRRSRCGMPRNKSCSHLQEETSEGSSRSQTTADEQRKRPGSAPRLNDMSLNDRSENGSRNVPRPPTLKREEAFYIRRAPIPYHRARTIMDGFSDKRRAEFVECLKKERNKCHRHSTEQLSMSDTDKQTSPPVVGRFQKHSNADCDSKYRFRGEQYQRKKDNMRLMKSGQKSASASNLFNPNQIIDDFVNDRL